MTTALITHDDCLAHEMPPGHPEQVARLRRVLAALDGKDVTRVTAPLAAEDDLLRVHPKSHIEAIRAAAPETGVCAARRGYMDVARHACRGTGPSAARCAASIWCLRGEARNAFVAARPPGHHAERETTMGFCLFGTVAAAAKYALDHHGLTRVAVVDFDVHHGNGTQDLLEDEPRALFRIVASIAALARHRGCARDRPAWHDPERAAGPAHGQCGFRRAWEETVFPRVRDFPARADPRLGRVRRASCRSAGRLMLETGISHGSPSGCAIWRMSCATGGW